MDMGWVHPWVGLGWVEFSDTVMVGSNDYDFIFSKSEMEVTPLSQTQRYDTESTRM